MSFPTLKDHYAIINPEGVVINVILAEPDWDIKENLKNVYNIGDVISCEEFGQAWIRGTWDAKEQVFVAPDVPAEED